MTCLAWRTCRDCAEPMGSGMCGTPRAAATASKKRRRVKRRLFDYSRQNIYCFCFFCIPIIVVRPLFIVPPVYPYSSRNSDPGSRIRLLPPPPRHCSACLGRHFYHEKGSFNYFVPGGLTSIDPHDLHTVAQLGNMFGSAVQPAAPNSLRAE